MKESINHKNVECHCLVALEQHMGEQEVFLGICYSENSKHSMEDVFGVVLIQ